MCTHVSVTASTLSAVRMENVSFHCGLISGMTLVLARLLSPVSHEGFLQGQGERCTTRTPGSWCETVRMRGCGAC